MKIRIADFKGEMPRRSDRLLPENVATISKNARLDDGRIEAYRESLLVQTLDVAAATIYFHNGTWLGFNQTTNIERGPVAQDRLYVTTVNDTPKMIVDGETYELALPSPTAKPVIAIVGTLDPDIAESILYTYTFVTEFDEESAPAPISDALTWSQGNDVQITGMSAAPMGRGINRRRIYRSQTSASGITDLYFVAEIPAAELTYTHDVAANPIQEVLPSANFDPPTDTLDGLVAMANGMMAGFSGREVFFCEPYQPHAWPRQYALIVDFDIVALASFGSTLAILTTGTPYIAQGTAPENMVMERMETNYPCISRRGVVDLGYSAAYPSNDGLIVISQQGVQMASRNLFSKEDWRNLVPSMFFAANYDGRYAFGYREGEIETIDGGTATAVILPGFITDKDENVVLDDDDVAYGMLIPSFRFYLDDYPFFQGGTPFDTPVGYVYYDGGNPFTIPAINTIGFIDLTGEDLHFLRTDAARVGSPETLFMDPASGNMFFLEDGTRVMQYDPRSKPVTAYTWRSKAFYFASPVSFAGVMVDSDTSEAQSILTTRVYADGKLVRETTRFNVPQRLPTGFRASEWQIEIEGNASVTMISMGETLEELAVP